MTIKYEPQLSLFKLYPHAEVDVEVKKYSFSYFFVSYSEKTNFLDKQTFFDKFSMKTNVWYVKMRILQCFIVISILLAPLLCCLSN